MASFGKWLPARTKVPKTYKPAAEPPRHPDSKHTHRSLLELVRAQGLAMLLLLLHRVAVIVATREHPPQIRTWIDEKRRGGGFWKSGPDL